MIIFKSKREVEKIHTSCQIVAQVLEKLALTVRAGITTRDLDILAENLTRQHKAKPAFKGYKGYPYSLCASVNDEVVHGIPGERVLQEGDLLSLDFGVVYEGYYGDAAITVPVGVISDKAKHLIEVTSQSLTKGIEKALVENYLSDISYAIQSYVEESGFSVVRDFVGHGIGQSLHEDPQVPNYGKSGMGIKLREGLVLAIEPMVCAGGAGVEILSDGWTAVTMDSSLAAHFEHTVAITSHGPVILSQIEES